MFEMADRRDSETKRDHVRYLSVSGSWPLKWRWEYSGVFVSMGEMGVCVCVCAYRCLYVHACI